MCGGSVVSKNIRDIVQEVNESLEDSQELTGTQRNALMLVHLITTVEDIGTKVDEGNARITSLEAAMKNSTDELQALKRRVEVLENNSLSAIVRTILIFVKDNPKLTVGVLIAIALAFGIAPETVRIIAAALGYPVP